MKDRSGRELHCQIAVAIFAVAGVISLGFIPGVGILLLGAACVVGFLGFAVNWRIPRIPGTGIWAGLVIALFGIPVIFLVEPISGVSILLGGIALAILSAVYQWFETVRHR